MTDFIRDVAAFASIAVFVASFSVILTALRRRHRRRSLYGRRKAVDIKRRKSENRPLDSE
jgi:hypothetical protein